MRAGSNVTDWKWFDSRFEYNPNYKGNKKILPTNIDPLTKKKFNRVGFYMDTNLMQNLMFIPKRLKEAYDTVGIVSGRGLVRVGKSVMAQQVGFFCAWLIAGGKMEKIEYRDPKTNQVRNKWVVAKLPTKDLNFSLDNIVFRPEELKKRAFEAFKKYGKNQVIIYDEGRTGLDSASSMSSINKMMQDFFQECGFMNHIILIVLPNFFKLHEDYSVSRSLFLIDVYPDQKMKRGYFSFYNTNQKEWLYFLGKKKIGISQKYYSAPASFNGRFIDFSPIDKKLYEDAKARAMNQKKLSNQQHKYKKRLDAAILILNKNLGMSEEEIADWLSVYTKESISAAMIKSSLRAMGLRKEMEQD